MNSEQREEGDDIRVTIEEQGATARITVVKKTGTTVFTVPTSPLVEEPEYDFRNRHNSRRSG